MTLTRKTPLRRKRASKRTYKTPRCSRRGCGNPMRWQDGDDVLCDHHALMECKARWSRKVRAIGQCELRGRPDPITGTLVECGGPLQGAHGFPKGAYPSVQFDLSNGISLCSGHHRYYTDRWPEWRQVMIDRLGQADFDALLLRANKRGASRDYAAVLESLR